MLISFVAAQTTATQPLARTLKFSVYAIKRTEEPLMYLPRPDAKPVALMLQSSNRSGDYVYKGTSPLEFFTETKELDGQLKRRLMASAELPEKANEVFVVLFQNPNHAEAKDVAPFKAHFFDVSTKSVPSGSLMLLNATGLRFYIKINEKIAEARAGATLVFNVGNKANIEIKTLFNGDYISVYSRQIPLGGAERKFMLLSPSPYEKALKPVVQFFRWEVEVPERRGR